VTYHLIGIGGIGMSAIARILLARGDRVSGSDVTVTPLIERLRDEGIRVAIGHTAANVGAPDAVVVSSAIDRANPEYVAAARGGIPVIHRGEMLAQLLRERRGIAVCGTHGKTTTTAMAHAVLRGGGVDAGLVLGGIDRNLDTNAHPGTSRWFVTEADESDGSFALLDPQIAIVTNIENDHLNSDDELPGLVRAFGEFLAKLPDDGWAIIGADNALSASLAEHDLRCGAITYGLTSAARLRAEDLEFRGFGSRFTVVDDMQPLGEIELRVPGAMNVQNALAAIAVGRVLQLPFATTAQALRGFGGVRRRFDILLATDRVIIVDDYAHHPTAVRATIAAARRYHEGALIVAFQPHRFTRTAYLAHEFADALQAADRVYLTPVYAASEPAIPGVSERSIGERIARKSLLETEDGSVRYVESVDDLERRILDEAPPGAMVLMLGAGNITDVAARMAQAARV
jgi:UDP-N-acetylmuramate--alanine ligase